MRESLPLRRQWLLTQLLSRCSQGSSLHELARELDYSQKTIRRDLETLRSAGFPIEETTEAYGRKHWRLNGGPNKPPQITFNLEEVSALYLGRRFLEPLAGTLFWKGAEDAFRKVRALLGDNALRHLEKMAAAWHQTTFGKSDYARQAELIDELMIAIEDEKVTLITYQSARATEPVTHEVYPYGLVSHRHALYLIAFDSELREIRNYKVNRIESALVKSLKQTVKPKDFDLDQYLENAFGIYVKEGPEQTARVRFSPTVARYVEEHEWHPSQSLTKNRDGSLTAEFRLRALEEFKSWIQSFGPHAVVLEPEELRDEIVQDLEKTLAAYGVKERK